ncbi:hypothetical protein EDD16DRAFT_1523887 [Pisolithus croceorrhizus]|nr:hypothetical protein EDD16DRAFT_1523887 [Pisolithus croceorrhizus]KAI6107535.1 hypothetical protein EV401DRAFT_1892006 [Pisolithus croceorrhizus]KAI6163419.1 hypothetical protein EDD17DRAFT_1812992 [Pisolithus thermaeus]
MVNPSTLHRVRSTSDSCFAGDEPQVNICKAHLTKGDPLAFYGKSITEDYHASLMAKLPKPLNYDKDKNGFFDISDDKLCFLPDKKVGILGAGVGGLYTALILDSLGIEFEILGASDRVGGRLSTYKFLRGQRYDYYDTGAMRYPLPKKDGEGRYKNGIMKRLAELIIYAPLNQGSHRLVDKLIPYYYKAREDPNLKPGFYYFNGVRERISNKPGDFRAKDLGVADSYVKAGVNPIASDVLKPFARMLIEDTKGRKREGWEMMMANDSYSVRAYMSFKYLPSVHLELPPQHLPTNVVNWCELLEDSTKSYDRALTEEVFGSLAFAMVDDKDFGDVDWKCFEMAQVIDPEGTGTGNRIHFGKKVTAICQGHDLIITVPSDYPIGKPPKGTTVTAAGDKYIITVPGAGVAAWVSPELEPRVYSHVISTLPLPVLRTIDMSDAGMNVMQTNALRQLQYGPSVKTAILFKEAWWTDKLGIVGGQSFTDLPIRTIVYPSYGAGPLAASRVLIASYCWTSDAERLSSLATPQEIGVLTELVLRNLADVHGPPITREFLRSQFVDIHVKDWTRDAQTMGAFAQFGPGDFQNLYNSLAYPAADLRLHFAGEAISTRHGWVVGALDSAWRAVDEYLCVTRQMVKRKRFKELWGENIEWASPPAQPFRHGEHNKEPENKSNLLDEHLGLIYGAIGVGEIKMPAGGS